MSFCLIIADAEGLEGKDLQLLQVIESLIYNRSERKVLITFDIFLKNQRSQECELILVHRGLNSCKPSTENLISSKNPNPNPDSWSDNSVISREDILRAIYGSRIIDSLPNELSKPGFVERSNCFGIKKDHTTIDNCDPKKIKVNPLLLLEEKVWENGVFPPFSAFAISPLPPGTSWFRFESNIAGKTYDYFVDYPIHFWVDGPNRVMNQILNEDIPQRGHLQPECAEFFNTKVMGHILKPIAYDIVIHRPGTDGVNGDICCSPSTGDEFVASLSHPAIAKRAFHFVTRSTVFWIDLYYSDDPRLCPGNPGSDLWEKVSVTTSKG